VTSPYSVTQDHIRHKWFVLGDVTSVPCSDCTIVAASTAGVRLYAHAGVSRQHQITCHVCRTPKRIPPKRPVIQRSGVAALFSLVLHYSSRLRRLAPPSPPERIPITTMAQSVLCSCSVPSIYFQPKSCCGTTPPSCGGCGEKAGMFASRVQQRGLGMFICRWCARHQLRLCYLPFHNSHDPLRVRMFIYPRHSTPPVELARVHFRLMGTAHSERNAAGELPEARHAMCITLFQYASLMMLLMNACLLNEF